MRVVLDTNIWISAIIWGGLPDRLLILQANQQITIAISEELLQELANTLNKKKLKPKLQILEVTVSEIINLFRESVIVFSITPIEVANLRDPDDSVVLATAIAAQADAIITGDKDLLILDQFSNIPILTVQDFLNSMN